MENQQHYCQKINIICSTIRCLSFFVAIILAASSIGAFFFTLIVGNDIKDIALMPPGGNSLATIFIISRSVRIPIISPSSSVIGIELIFSASIFFAISKTLFLKFIVTVVVLIKSSTRVSSTELFLLSIHSIQV